MTGTFVGLVLLLIAASAVGGWRPLATLRAIRQVDVMDEEWRRRHAERSTR